MRRPALSAHLTRRTEPATATVPLTRAVSLSRRRFLGGLSLAFATPLLASCTPRPATPEASEPFVRPQRLSTGVTRLSDGSFERWFRGAASPQNLEFLDEDDGATHRILDLFPRDNCPFAIDTTKELGEGGYSLTITDRTLAGEIPTDADAAWPLNMVPFGVAIDGVIIDPSGPWYDGGPADPQNPFDRGCSGWEYDPVFSTVADLVGVPAAVRGHVQPGPGGKMGSPGLFHYHGAPRVMLSNLRRSLDPITRTAPLVVGYSADGFWLLDSVIPAEARPNGKRLHLFSGYLLREGTRAAVPHTNPALVPPGKYDGTFVQDWQFDPDAKRARIEEALQTDGEHEGLRLEDIESGAAEFAVLDRRNGLVSEDFTAPGAPKGAYVYVMTPDWPEVPRWFAREPSEPFRKNIIPLDSPAGMGPPGRQQLYDNCDASLSDVHQWSGRPPY